MIDLTNCDFVHVKLPGEFVPEVKDKEIVLAVVKIGDLTCIKGINFDPPSGEWKQVMISLVASEIEKSKFAMDIVAKEIETTAKEMFNV